MDQDFDKTPQPFWMFFLWGLLVIGLGVSSLVFVVSLAIGILYFLVVHVPL